jgi:hypothetical protein
MINLKKTAWVNYVLSIMVLVCMNACENPLKNVNPGADQGLLKIEIGVEMKIFTANARMQAVFTDNFLVSVKDVNDEVYLSFDRAVDMPPGISIDPGDYYVEVQSPNDVYPAFDNPKYFGRSDVFTIGSNEEKAVTVTASLANCMVSVIYSQNVIDNFVDYYTVVFNSQGSITFSSEETRTGYFDLLPLSVEAHLSHLLGDGSLVTKIINGEILLPVAQTHYEIHIDGSLDPGTALISIMADETFLTEIIDISDQGIIVNEGDVPYGALLITEIMYNPTAISDTEGEWLEIYNTSTQPVDLFQLVLKKGTEVQHIVNESILIDPQQHLIMARHINATVSASYIYGSDLTLTNTGDDLILANFGSDGTDGQVIAEVNYGNAGFPDGSGASLNLDANAYDVNQAQLGSNWCVSTAVFDTGDLGTPGIQNNSCTQ